MKVGPPALYRWRGLFGGWVEELAAMLEELAEVGVPMTQADVDREIRATWQIMCEKIPELFKLATKTVSEFDLEYPRKIFSDALARRMGWMRGRLDHNDERTMQRQLEAAGQIRIEGC